MYTRYEFVVRLFFVQSRCLRVMAVAIDTSLCIRSVFAVRLQSVRSLLYRRDSCGLCCEVAIRTVFVCSVGSIVYGVRVGLFVYGLRCTTSQSVRSLVYDVAIRTVFGVL